MITIHPELQSLIPPLTAEEYAQLEANLLMDGCHAPLIVWQEEHTLLDGHNRFQICERHSLPYTIAELSLPDLDAAKGWMLKRQLGRRNLTPEQMSYLRGKQYLYEKHQGKRTDRTSPHTEERLTTAHKLAAQHKVSRPTIERDAAFASAIDTLTTVGGAEARQAILARDAKVNREDVKRLADLAATAPQLVHEVLEDVQAAPTPRAAKAVVAKAVAPKNGQATATAVRDDRAPVVVREKQEADDWIAAVLAGVRPLATLVELTPETPPTRETCLRHLEAVVSAAVTRLTAAPVPDTPVSPHRPAPSRTAGPLADQVRQAAKKLRRFTNATMAKRLGKNPSDVFHVLQRLVKRGELHKEDKAYIVVPTPAGTGRRKDAAHA